MKILFVFTGGTIGSTLGEGNIISPDAAKSYKIIEAYGAKYPVDFEYDTLEPYTELSENNTGANLKRLAACVAQKLDGGYDGIVITHGTDTLQYTAAALGYAIGNDSVPICIVSATRPIEHAQSNALDNLHAAVSFIRQGAGRGVFVPYRNDNSDTVMLHRATRLLAGKAFSDEVSSIFDSVYGHFDADFKFIKNENYSEKADEIAPLDLSSLKDFSEKILLLPAYTGMNYTGISKKVKYILLNTYHSGTVNTKSERAKKFFLKAKKKGVRVYATGVTGGPDYASAAEYDALGIVGLKNVSPVAAYIKLWILSEIGADTDSAMTASLAGDIV